jgi:hypothetical protein
MNAKAAALVAAQSTDSLVGALLILEAKGELTAEERLVRAWTIEGLETRYPAAAAAVEAAFDAAETVVMNDPEAAYPDVDYVAVLLAHIPA